MKALIACLVIPVLTALGVAALLWFWVGTGAIEVSPWIVGAATALTLWIVWTAVNGLKSRNHRDAIAFRKMLATGRRYFALELLKERPSLRDEWYPWIAGFGLVNEVAQWSVRHRSDDSYHSTTFSSSSSESSSSSAAWTGAAGGRSGGAGGGAAWATAVGGMAAGVSPPSSSSGSNGGSSSGSSSGGSSGGGGGGGW